MPRAKILCAAAGLLVLCCKQSGGPSGPWMERARAGETLYAAIETDHGTMVARLFSKEAPKTVESFVGLASGEKAWTDPRGGLEVTRPLYDGTRFHRVIPGFMIQGGDPRGDGTGDPGFQLQDELQSGRKFDKPCLLSMANRGPNTAGCQFFITEQPTPWLNGRFTIFGELVQGCERVAAIARVARGPGDVPLSPVTIRHIAISDRAP